MVDSRKSRSTTRPPAALMNAMSLAGVAPAWRGTTSVPEMAAIEHEHQQDGGVHQRSRQIGRTPASHSRDARENTAPRPNPGFLSVHGR